MINKIVDPNLKNSLEQSYFDKINVLKAQNLQAEASDFARQLAERLRKGQTIDWNLVEQKIRDYSPDSKKLQREFSSVVYDRFLKLANSDSSLKPHVYQLRTRIKAILLE